MIANSSAFIFLISNYISNKDTSNEIIKRIKFFEEEMNNRVPINDINISNYNLALEKALQHIIYADNILDWCMQLKLKIKAMKHVVEKKLEIETINVTKEIEQLDELAEITTKTERTARKNFLLKDKLINITQRYEDVKLDYETIEMFINSANNMREARYAYYQAVKLTYKN